MFAVFRKEVASFFTTPVGFLVAGLFLVLSGLFLWVFKGPFNILDYGFADLSLFFLLAPWVLLLLIPAITMKSFSEEQKLGTLELLLSKPLSTRALVFGKYLGICTLVVLTLIPTLLYVATISDLGTTSGNLDTGLVWGSYIGLLALSAVYASVGLFASSVTSNQVTAFILAVLICFLLYFGFDSLATLIPEGGTALTIEGMGLGAHYENIGQGILDSRDLIYFLSLSAFFLFLSICRINSLRK